MIKVESRKNQRIAVLGMGLSGMASAKALENSGANVTVWDDNSTQREKAERAGFKLSNPEFIDFSSQDALLIAPGIPLLVNPHPAVSAARAADKPITSDIELLIENCGRARLIGITGTNGKSTTTELTAHILAEAGLKHQAGGNLGLPALGFKHPCDQETLVLELSSFQLDITENAAFDIAILTNITPDHLDRHGTMDAYISAKRRIFLRPRVRGSSVAIISIDDPHSAEIHKKLERNNDWKVFPVSTKGKLINGVFVKNGILFDACSGMARRICDLNPISVLQGEHNQQNAACAYAAAMHAGVSEKSIVRGLQNFKGLPHRMERVGKINNIELINDSKATNVQAANIALNCSNDVFWIAGGRGKGEDFSPLAAHAKKIRAAFLIGEAAHDIAKILPETVPVTISNTLEKAFEHAIEAALRFSNAATILLSPACTAFDQFENFSERGNIFRAIAEKIKSGAYNERI